MPVWRRQRQWRRGGSDYTGAWIYEGSLWESFEDSQGGFDIETNLSTGKKTVHMGNVAAFLIKPPPPNSEMKRSKLVYGPMASAQTLAEAKKKAEQEKRRQQPKKRRKKQLPPRRLQRPKPSRRLSRRPVVWGHIPPA